MMGRLKVKHSNPKGLHDSKFYSQVVTVSGHGKTIYIGGQNAINAEGQLIGKDDLELQTKQVLKNIETALSSENATFKDIIKFNIYLVEECVRQLDLRNFRKPLVSWKNLL